MAYNGYFPYGYQQNYPSYQQNYQSQNVQSQSGILWVQGVEAAKAYPVAPGSNVLLMDSDSSLFFIKSADQSGMPSMRTFEYKEVSGNSNASETSVDMSVYVTHEELEKALAELTQKKKEGKKNE